jgi:hypothetical protein
MSIYLATEDNVSISDLVDQALAANGLVLTRGGRMIAELRIVNAEPNAKKWASKDDMLSWLDSVRVKPRNASVSVSELLQDMRDEY